MNVAFIIAPPHRLFTGSVYRLY